MRALIKTGKPSVLISALHSRKALSFKYIAEVSEQISHLLNCAMENNRKRKLRYLFSHVTLGLMLSKHRYRSASLQKRGLQQTFMSQNPRFASKSFFLTIIFPCIVPKPKLYLYSCFTIIFPYIVPRPKLYLYQFFTVIFPYIVPKPEQSRASQLVQYNYGKIGFSK